MLCIDNAYIDVYFNLAAEEYLLKNFTEDIFMLWQNEPSVIVGKHQNVPAEVDLNYAQATRIKVARRFSGGGTVYHDLGNLNLTFIETNENVNFDKFARQITALLSELGINARLDERRAIFIGDLKISGSAQYVHKNRMMYHATLLFSTDLQHLVTVLEGSAAQVEEEHKHRLSVKSVKSPVTNLTQHLNRPFDIAEMKKFILNYFLKKDIGNSIYEFDEKDIATIKTLENIKYVTPEWNLYARALKY